jgi:hypothetical protein
MCIRDRDIADILKNKHGIDVYNLDHKKIKKLIENKDYFWLQLLLRMTMPQLFTYIWNYLR